MSGHQVGGKERPYLFTGWVCGQAKTGCTQSILQKSLSYLEQWLHWAPDLLLIREDEVQRRPTTKYVTVQTAQTRLRLFYRVICRRCWSPNCAPPCFSGSRDIHMMVC